MDELAFRLVKPPNIEIEMGKDSSVRFAFNEKKTLAKRFKWWLFCKVFPFKVARWDKE